MELKITRTIAEIRSVVSEMKRHGKRVAFVPTMGALHEGHFSLMQKAREKGDAVIVSIFVNPTQFSPGEDFSKYPRMLETDLDHCRREGVDAVFCPERDEVYPSQKFIRMELDGMGDHLCGKSRPGHFNGVIQVVNKLFNIVKPDAAVFGQKDIQQFTILKRMAEEFNHDVEMVMAPTVRAADGLALSSRNRYLSKEERLIAPLLYQTLIYVRTGLIDGRKPDKILSESINEINQSGLKVDYLEIVSRDTLQPLSAFDPQAGCIIAGAVFAGSTRLIDNLILE